MHETRRAMLDAAIDIVAEDGVGALTFRTLEQRAEAAHGSVRYHFKTRRLLLADVLRHLATEDDRALRELLAGTDLAAYTDRHSVGELVAAILAEFVGASRRRTLARYELFLYAARRPELQPDVTRWRATFFRLAEPLLASMGNPDPATAARFFMSAFDGVLLGLLTDPDADFAAATTHYFQALLSALTPVGAASGGSGEG
jgi:AcrR family transcriptional regulator